MDDHLYMLWTNADKITSEKMVMMYATNARLKGWWENVTVIIWGGTAKLAGEDPKIQQLIQTAQQAGVKFSACKACSDQLGVTEVLEELGVEVIYWGDPLTRLLKERKRLMTI